MMNLLRQPRYLPRYVRQSLRRDSTPLHLELPWFSFAAIDFLAEFLQPHMHVCEYGTGGSTLFFARRVRSVVSIENSADWHDLVMEHLKRRSIRNVKLLLRPFDFRFPDGFEQSEYLHAIPPGHYDVIVIDCSEEWIPVRPACFRHVEDRVRPGGIIIVDDSWRYPEIRQNNKARHMETFKSVGPCRPGVTSTDIYFY